MTARDLFEQLREQWFGQPGPLTGDLLTDDVVVELPFAPGGPSRIEGRETFLARINPQRAAFPLRIDGSRVLAVHDTADPDTIVVEYELTATSTVTGRQSSSPFIAVLTARDGKVAGWREYQNTLAMQQAAG
jgi:uncharacterized protein